MLHPKTENMMMQKKEQLESTNKLLEKLKIRFKKV